MFPKGLPEKLCVLDLETAKLVRGGTGSTPLAFVGTRVYSLHGERYYPRRHQCYFPDELKKLESFLKHFEGVVLGHNILRFDYDEILRYLISLEGVVEKTVDTLAFLYEKRVTRYDPSDPYPQDLEGPEGLKGLSLDNLAQKNLGRAKAISGRSVPKLWRQGHREEVTAYNKVDLALTFSLWWWMVRGQTVVVGSPVTKPMAAVEDLKKTVEVVVDPGKVEISNEDVPRLAGKKPLFDTRVVMVGDGPELDPPPPDAFEEPVDYYWYRGCFARHYLSEDALLIRDPIFERLINPYCPASHFTFTVLQDGPMFPARERLEDEAIDIADL